MIISKKKYNELKENKELKEKIIENLGKSNKILENNNKKMNAQISKQREENIEYQEKINLIVNKCMQLDSIIIENKKEIKRLKTILTKNNIDYKKKDKNKKGKD